MDSAHSQSGSKAKTVARERRVPEAEDIKRMRKCWRSGSYTKNHTFDAFAVAAVAVVVAAAAATVAGCLGLAATEREKYRLCSV